MFVLDTCVVSEGMRTAPSPRVDAWLKQRSATELFISALTVGEVWFGIDQLSSGQQRMQLEHWFARVVVTGFRDRILPFDFHVAYRWGGLRVSGREEKVVDTQIAATALEHDFTLVTRNVGDFRFDGLKVVNPWEM